MLYSTWNKISKTRRDKDCVVAHVLYSSKVIKPSYEILNFRKMIRKQILHLLHKYIVYKALRYELDGLDSLSGGNVL